MYNKVIIDTGGCLIEYVVCDTCKSIDLSTDLQVVTVHFEPIDVDHTQTYILYKGYPFVVEGGGSHAGK